MVIWTGTLLLTTLSLGDELLVLLELAGGSPDAELMELD